MTIIKAYANYGVLAHEYQTIFTASNPHPYATVSDKIEITIPDGWTVSESVSGSLLIDSPDGQTYLADEIISHFGGDPILSWYDGIKENRIKLDWKAS